MNKENYLYSSKKRNKDCHSGADPHEVLSVVPQDAGLPSRMTKKTSLKMFTWFCTKTFLLAIYKIIRFIFRGWGLERFYPIKVIHCFVLKRLKSDFAIVQGHKMFLDLKDSLDLSIDGIYESFQTRLVKQLVKEGDVVLDIGANIGYYTLIFAKLVGKKGKVFAFEPDPTNFAVLKKNVKINGYKNVVLAQKAVSNKNGKLKLYLSKDNMGDHRIYDSFKGREFVQVESICLDDYFQGYNGKIHLIKMDIQGAEGGAIQGMYKLLKKNKKVKIAGEFWPRGLEDFGVEAKQYLDLLLKLGFKFYEINGRRRKIILIKKAGLLKKYTYKNNKAANLLCLR